MTKYTIDLLRKESLSRLTPTHKIHELCWHICENLLIYLSITCIGDDPKRLLVMAKLSTELRKYMSILGAGAPVYRGPSDYMFVTRIGIINKISHQNFEYQIFKMDTLQNVHPRYLVDFMSKLVKNGLTCIQPYPESLLSFTIEECERKINDVFYEIPLILLQQVNPIQSDLVSAIVQVEFKDSSEEKFDLCIKTRQAHTIPSNQTSNISILDRPVTFQEFL
jgi:hypothetical protein